MTGRRLALLLIALAVLGCVAPAVAAADDDESPRLTVMTRNLYVGSSFAHAIGAPSPTAFVQGVGTIWDNIHRARFPDRAEALADEIAATRPDLIGLQEVSLVRRQVPGDPATPATEVVFDYLAILLGELRRRGLEYEVLTKAEPFDVEAPALTAAGLFDVRLTDRDLILGRSDRRELRIAAAESGAYEAKATFPTAVGPIEIGRTWNAVDARIDGERFRFVNTHLDADFPAVQEAQAAELIAGPLARPGRVVAAGDFNSPADGSGTASYGLLLNAGFEDAWTRLRPRNPGLTCCQAELLDNPLSILSERIDLILTRGAVRARDVELVGERPRDRTSGLWPSDHAGVSARMRLR